MSAPKNVTPKRKILVKVPKFAGDIIMVLPALKALTQIYPEEGNTLYLLVKKEFSPLLDTPGAKWRLIPETTKRPPKGNLLSRLRGLLQRKRQRNIQQLVASFKEGNNPPFDVSISFTREIDYQRAFYLAGIPYRFGWDQRELVWWGRVNHPVEPLTRSSDPGRSDQVRYFMTMVESVFNRENDLRRLRQEWPPHNLVMRPVLEVSDTFKDFQFKEALKQIANSGVGNQRLLEYLSRNERRFFTIVTTTSKDSTLKRWPLKNFIATAHAIADWKVRQSDAQTDWIPIFSFGPNEEAVHDELCRTEGWNELVERHQAIAIMPGKLDMQPFMGLLASSRFLLTNDTGPRHIALALGTRVVTIFGPSPPERAVHAPHLERAIKLHDDCSVSCDLKRNRCEYGHLCMIGITPEMVVGHIQDFLRDAL